MTTAVNDADLSPDGDRILTAEQDGVARIWSAPGDLEETPSREPAAELSEFRPGREDGVDHRG